MNNNLIESIKPYTLGAIEKAYKEQESKARTNNISWEFDLKTWIGMWVKSGKLPYRGDSGDSYAMGRKDRNMPFSPENCVILTNSENAKHKTAKELKTISNAQKRIRQQQKEDGLHGRFHTPDGVFNSAQDASKHYKITVTAMMDRMRGSNFPDFLRELPNGSFEKKIKKGNYTKGAVNKFGIHTPSGVFIDAKTACVELGMSGSTLSRRVSQDKYPEFYYLTEPEKSTGNNNSLKNEIKVGSMIHRSDRSSVFVTLHNQNIIGFIRCDHRGEITHGAMDLDNFNEDLTAKKGDYRLNQVENNLSHDYISRLLSTNRIDESKFLEYTENKVNENTTEHNYLKGLIKPGSMLMTRDKTALFVIDINDNNVAYITCSGSAGVNSDTLDLSEFSESMSHSLKHKEIKCILNDLMPSDISTILNKLTPITNADININSKFMVADLRTNKDFGPTKPPKYRHTLYIRDTSGVYLAKQNNNEVNDDFERELSLN